MQLHAVAHGLLGNERGRNELRDVFAGLVFQVVLLGENEERVFSLCALHFSSVACDAACHATRPAVVRGSREIQGAELIAQTANEASGRPGGLHRIASFVHPPIHAQAHALGGGGHELPHADGSSARVCVGIEAALDEREIVHVLGHTSRLHLGADHRLVARATLEARGDAFPGTTRELPDIVGDAILRLKRTDVHVPCRLDGGCACCPGDGGDVQRVAEHFRHAAGNFYSRDVAAVGTAAGRGRARGNAGLGYRLARKRVTGLGECHVRATAQRKRNRAEDR